MLFRILTASYGKNLDVSFGNTLKVSDTQSAPEIHATFTDFDAASASDTKYTLILTDPDAPSRTDKAYSEYAHHIVTGLTLKAINNASGASAFSAEAVADAFAAPIDFSSGNEILKYEGPGPPPKTGLHRYVYILFKETKPSATEWTGERFRFGTDVPGTGVKDYASKQGLVPLAVNYFFAQNEDN